MKNELLEQIKNVMEEQDLRYYCDEKEHIGAGFKDFVIMFQTQEEYLEFQVRLKNEVPEEYQTEMLKYLNYINCIMKEGHWEMHPEGELIYRIFTDLSVENSIEDYYILMDIKRGCTAVAAFGEGMKQIMSGEADAKVAYEMALAAQMAA